MQARTSEGALSNSRKRARKSKKKKKKKAVMPGGKKPKTEAVQKPFAQEELHCIVCFDLPSGGEVFQCKNGHLLCKECHGRVVEGDKAQCPACRARLSRERPVRNRFAEDVLAMLLVPCSLPGCEIKLQHSKLQEHEQKECQFRAAICKFELLGCCWTGRQNQLKEHQKKCSLRSMTPKQLLKLARKREDQAKQASEAKELLHKAEANMCKVMSSRCRNITVRDLVLHQVTDRSTAHPLLPVMESGTFGAAGSVMEVSLMESGVGELRRLGLVVRVVSSQRGRPYLKMIVQTGPNLSINLRPAVFRLCLSRSSTVSKPCFLSLTTEDVQTLVGLPQASFRVTFLDCSSGPPQATFTTLNLPEEDESVDEFDSDADSDSEGFDDEEGWSSGGLDYGFGDLMFS